MFHLQDVELIFMVNMIDIIFWKHAFCEEESQPKVEREDSDLEKFYVVIELHEVFMF
jgi:hypothetical protein